MQRENHNKEKVKEKEQVPEIIGFGVARERKEEQVNKGTGSRNCTFRNYRKSIHRKKGKSQSSER
jgi:hypothetical protein